MLSSYGRSNLSTPFSDRHSLQSSTTPTSNPITTLLSTHFPPASLLPPGVTSASPTREDHSRDHPSPYPYHPAAFASYQNSLKLKKKKQRTTKIGPDGIPLKRKSREGSTTYLWEFLLKLLQVIEHLKPKLSEIIVCMSRTKNVVPDTSSGQTERRASSSLWTARLYPDCGDYTRTNRTWITRLWAEHSGMNSLTNVSLILLSILDYIDFDSKSYYFSKFRVGLQRK